MSSLLFLFPLLSPLCFSYCNSSLAAGYEEKTCTNNEIVYVNLAMMTWECNTDDDRCPGAFHVGCQSDSAASSLGLGLASLALVFFSALI